MYVPRDRCRLGPFDKTAVGFVTVDVNDLNLNTGDKIVFNHPYFGPYELNSTSTDTQLTIPSRYVEAVFSSNDDTDVGTGFNLTFTPSTRGCDQSLVTSSVDDKKSTLSSPWYGKGKCKAGTVCEYRITTVDPTKRVRIFFKAFGIGSPAALYMNPDGDAYYSSDVETIQNPLPTKYYWSNGNTMRLYLDCAKAVTGFKIFYVQTT